MNAPRPRQHSPLWTGFLPDAAPPLKKSEMAAFAGERILITGAGGFLGSALARRLARSRAAHLILLDHAEHGLYRLDQQLRALPRTPPFSLVVGRVGDRALLRELFQQKPSIVLHAAACKHVPLMQLNPFAAVETNVFATLALVRAAQQAQTPQFLLVSTDKAVAPIGVMGATKRFAEQIVLAARAPSTPTCDFKALRLCNVLGSSGSVAPLFAQQIRAGGPLTVAHPKATRFFLSRRDAVRHLLRAATTPSPTGLWIPAHVGHCRIAELASYMLSRTPRPADVAVVHTGLRPADKLHEQLTGPGEQLASTVRAGLRAVTSPFRPEALTASLHELGAALRVRDLDALLAALTHLPPVSAAPADTELLPQGLSA